MVDKQIVTCLDEMVVNILMCLYDSDDLDESIRNLDPQPNPPFYNSYNIKTTLDYLTKSFSGSGKSLVEILCKSPVKLFCSMQCKVNKRSYSQFSQIVAIE